MIGVSNGKDVVGIGEEGGGVATTLSFSWLDPKDRCGWILKRPVESCLTLAWLDEDGDSEDLSILGLGHGLQGLKHRNHLSNHRCKFLLMCSIKFCCHVWADYSLLSTGSNENIVTN